MTDPAGPESSLDHLRVRFVTFREATAAEQARRGDALRAWPARERVLLETCHRVELISVDDSTDQHAAASGPDAVRRVFEVVAGFDSAVLAEEQLLGQARAAYGNALAAGTTGPILNELMRRALRFGRRVRSHATPGTDRSLADRGVRWLRERLSPDEAVLVAGTGEMAAAVASALARDGHAVTVVSRSPERAERLVGMLPGQGHRPHAGSSLPALDGFAAVAMAVRSREPLLTLAGLDRRAPPWVLDLSAPSAISPDAVIRLGDRAMSIDRIGLTTEPTPVLRPAVERRLHRELDEAVDAFIAWHRSRSSADAVGQLHAAADAVRQRHLRRLGANAALAPEQLAAVDAATQAMMRELLHGASVELRHGGADVATVRRLFALGPSS